jgi:hypothetical protein
MGAELSNLTLTQYELAYWKKRCGLAEAFIDSHVACPDLTNEMIENFYAWQCFKEKNPSK